MFDAETPYTTVDECSGVNVVVPHLIPGRGEVEATSAESDLLAALFRNYEIRAPLAWFYTPMALPLLNGVAVSGVVFDCMDELSGFANAPAEMRLRERQLLNRSSVVFTGGYSLFEVKRLLHPNVHAFPSSVDVDHFAQARRAIESPDDQQGIPRPRIGFCGVIDERMDLDLVREVAQRRPDWQIVMLGPVAKIEPSALPRGPNLHYLGMKRYDDLPAYFAGWDVAIMPFAHNDSTRFISPTKTPEYLAAGCPVVSTSIRDVVRPYGEEGLLAIADTPETFVAAITAAMTSGGRAAVATRGNGGWTDVAAAASSASTRRQVASQEVPRRKASARA